MSDRRIYDLDRDMADISAALERSRCFLRIMLKIKNDVAGLEEWVSHHSKIVGPEGLLIFDNSSTEDEMFDAYAKLPEQIIVAGYSGSINRIHRVNEANGLYSSIRKTSDYFTFLDADEFLGWIDQDGAMAFQADVVENIKSVGGAAILPGFWLENILGFPNRFKINSIRGLGPTHGKPTIAATCGVSGMINHNFQVSRDLYQGPIIFNSVVQHRKNQTPARRINANLVKLRGDKSIQIEDMTVERILALDPNAVRNPVNRSYVVEIQQLWPLRDNVFDSSTPVAKGELLVGVDGRCIFHSDQDRHTFLSFFREYDLSDGLRLIMR